ncbi:uncharacterized protein RSE6_04953 [Rhynchosporium secalis]|uniref:Uncharacterized protein n=1 Tax=Rhynchosporium secalis TaxID=38038 RepID=A0A1E1M6M5_RHYSE|nr:uncharacterized protein RSE6_04953 [Rhynchosporium secalis]
MIIQKRPFSIFLEYVSAERYSRKTILRSSSTLRSKVYSDGGIKTKIFALSVIHDMLYVKGLSVVDLFCVIYTQFQNPKLLDLISEPHFRLRLEGSLTSILHESSYMQPAD